MRQTYKRYDKLSLKKLHPATSGIMASQITAERMVRNEATVIINNVSDSFLSPKSNEPKFYAEGGYFSWRLE